MGLLWLARPLLSGRPPETAGEPGPAPELLGPRLLGSAEDLNLRIRLKDDALEERKNIQGGISDQALAVAPHSSLQNYDSIRES